MPFHVLFSSPLNPKSNAGVFVNTYPEIEKAISDKAATVPDEELMNMQVTIMTTQNLPKYTFGLRRDGRQHQTKEQIFALAGRNKYVKDVECTRDGNYLIIDNYPREYTSAEHSAVPIPRQTTLTYGQASFPVYTVNGLSKRPAINPGQPLPVVIARMQKRLRDEKVNKQ